MLWIQIAKLLSSQPQVLFYHMLPPSINLFSPAHWSFALTWYVVWFDQRWTVLVCCSTDIFRCDDGVTWPLLFNVFVVRHWHEAKKPFECRWNEWPSSVPFLQDLVRKDGQNKDEWPVTSQSATIKRIREFVPLPHKLLQTLANTSAFRQRPGQKWEKISLCERNRKANLAKISETRVMERVQSIECGNLMTYFTCKSVTSWENTCAKNGITSCLHGFSVHYCIPS